MKKRKAHLINVSYVEKEGQTYAVLLLKGKKITKLYYPYDPYFLVDAPEEEKDTIRKIATQKNGKTITVKKVDTEERIVNFKKKKFLKIVCHSPKDIPLIKHVIPYPAYEFDIPYVKRFLFDFQLTPLWVITYEREGKIIKKIIKCEEKIPLLKSMAFDIETYNPLGVPRPKKDPVIMISYANGQKGVLTYKKTSERNAIVVSNEKEMIEKFNEIVKKEDPDIIFGYNSGNFDLPYLAERAKILKIPLVLGRKEKIKITKKGVIGGVALDGRIHIDLYPIIRLFGFIGVLKTADYTLDAVASEILGKNKIALDRENLWKIWDSDNIDDLVKYSLRDSELTIELGKNYLPLEIELSIITKQQLFDTTLSTSGQLVENLLMFHSVKRKEVIPTKPVGNIIEERLAAPIQGAFVKLPQPGIYDNIAVLDFRSLYPSIIVSFNIDPSALTKENSNDCYISPTGARFRKEPKALIPAVLEELIDFRAKLKKQLKTIDKKSEEYQKLSARVQAIKILANSFYGYMAYARSRWYSRECGESITAWGRKYIQETMEKAERAGFTVIYGDTDSVMILYKKKEDVFKFIEEVNRSLPEKMELELEAFYTRGVFVGKKGSEEEKGAKKKYALLGEDGRIKIRGFELVRRDWSPIAKETQYRVLETILREGNEKKAVNIVKEAIERLKGGKVSMDELTIITQLNKDPKAGYAVISPELAAAKKQIARGIPLEQGSLIAYVITKNGRTISEKAMPVELAKDYDADYYINNQILPAVMKILKELGYDEYELKKGGKQHSLNSFFE
ncbi:MAG: DNA-directed DNA polymerase [Candidatus Bilamarchaeaceae archaeon]